MIYIYDGTWDGLMCLVYRTALDESVPEEILRDDDSVDQGLLFETARIDTNENVAEATAMLLRERSSGVMWSDLWFALLSGDRGVDMALWRTLERAWREGKRAGMDLADPFMDRVRRAALHTGGEYNKYLGVIRFKDVGGIFYARMEPDCDVLPLLAGHFAKRLSDQGWVLHDIRRGRAAIFDGNGWHIEDMRLDRIPQITSEEAAYQKLWREFYRSTTTHQRLNYKVQRTHMPKKYWKHLVETPGEPYGKAQG